MSRFKEVRLAIGQALRKADTECLHFYDHFRYPLGDRKKIYNEFGKINPDNSGEIHAITWSRSGSPQNSNVKQVFSGATQVRQKVETWDIELWLTCIDGVETSTEEKAQELCDKIEDQFFIDSDFRALQKKWKIDLQNVSLVEFSRVVFADFHCHYAKILLTVGYPNYGQTAQ